MGLLYVKVYKVLEYLSLVKKYMQYYKVPKFSLVKSLFPTRNYSILLQALPPPSPPPGEVPKVLSTYITTEDDRENKYLRSEKRQTVCQASYSKMQCG